MNSNSWRDVSERLRLFAEGHYQVQRFAVGEIGDLDKEQVDATYPLMFAVHPNITPVDGALNYSLEILFVDLARDFEEKGVNQVQVISDLARIALDLISEVKNGSDLFGEDVAVVGGQAQIDTGAQEYNNNLCVARLTFSLEIPFAWNACEIPAEYAPAGSGQLPGGGYPDWCDKLIYCPVIIQILADLDQKLEFVSVDGVTIIGDGTPGNPLEAVGGGGGGSVDSVNGQTGVVVLDAEDLGAWPLVGTGTDLANGTIVVDPTFSDPLFFSDDATNDVQVYLTPSAFQVVFTGASISSTLDIGINGIQVQIGSGGFTSRFQAEADSAEMSISGPGGSASFIVEVNGDSDAATYPYVNIINRRRYNFDGVAAPTVNDDGTRGYANRSFWVYNGRFFICTSATTGAAAWVEVGAGGSGIPWTVVNASLTAANKTLYVNVASATYTDPTPAEGEGFIVFVRNGTATVGGTGYSTAGSLIYRIYHSGAWANYLIGGGGGSGTVNSGTANRLTYYAATGTTVSELAAITAARALKSDANGLPVAFDTATEPSLTELSYVKGVTSAIQTQLNAINVEQMNGQYGATIPTVPAAGTRYASLQGRENIATAEVGARLTMRGSGTFRGIYLETNNAQPVTGGLTVTLRKNGADTALTFTIAAGSAAGVYSDTANTVTFADGDTFNFKIDNAAPALASAQILNTSVMYTRN